MNKIVVFQTWGIGDMVMATPMLGALRQRMPNAEITVIAGSREAADVIDGSYLCDHVRIISLRKIGFIRLVREFRLIKKDHFDTALICTRISPCVAQCLKLFSKVGIIAGDGVGRRKWGYTHWRRADVRQHRVDANLGILDMILAKSEAAPLCFHIDADSKKRAADLWLKLGLGEKLVLGVHPGSSTRNGASKRIPLRLCLSISANFLERFPNARVMIVLGPSDSDILSALAGVDARISIVHNTPIRITGSLISRMRMFVAGDTGLGHIAASQGISVITLAGPTQVSATSPRGDNTIVIRSNEEVSCMPCYDTKKYGYCRHHNRCMESISDKQVMDAITVMYDRGKN